MQATSLSPLGLSCPKGGRFYICLNNQTEFIGCCTSDPCADDSGRCPDDDLRPASFSSDSYEDLPKQDCASSEIDVAWYTCSAIPIPFLGCCKDINPCSHGSCPRELLSPAILSSDPEERQVFVDEVSPPSSSTSSSTTASAETSTSSPSPTGCVASNGDGGAECDEGGDGDGGLHPGAIAGITIAATIAVIALFALFVFRRRFKRKPKGEGPDGGAVTALFGGPAPAGEYSTVPTTGSPEGKKTRQRKRERLPLSTWRVEADMELVAAAVSDTAKFGKASPGPSNAWYTPSISQVSWSPTPQPPSGPSSPGFAELPGNDGPPLNEMRLSATPSELPVPASPGIGHSFSSGGHASQAYVDELQLWTGAQGGNVGKPGTSRPH